MLSLWYFYIGNFIFSILPKDSKHGIHLAAKHTTSLLLLPWLTIFLWTFCRFSSQERCRFSSFRSGKVQQGRKQCKMLKGQSFLGKKMYIIFLVCIANELSNMIYTTFVFWIDWTIHWPGWLKDNNSDWLARLKKKMTFLLLYFLSIPYCDIVLLWSKWRYHYK